MSSGDTQSPPESGAEPDSATPSTGPSAGSHQTTSSSSQSQNTFDTQPPSSQDQPEDHVDTQAWGQLTIIGSNITHDLIKDSYIVGRGDQCDFLLRDKTPPTKQSSLWKACSKQHFKIYVETKSTGRYIFIQDLSSNGTIVNKELVGKGRFTVLKQGDVISLVKKDWRAYMFMDVGAKDESKGLPEAIKSKYLFIKELGRGACGQVMLAICRESKVRVACKCIEKQSFSFSRSNKDLMKEVRIILQLNHPCVIKVVDVIDTEETLYIFMELVEGGDLFELIKTSVRLEPECVKFIFYQMCLAIKHLHDNHIVHRDLKPENIMLTSIVPGCQMAKVTDFGLSNMVETSSLLKSLCGTPFYVAPEVVETSGMGTGYTKAVDCWSLGVILFVCITGGPAFSTQRKDMELRDQILTGNYALKDKYWEHLPQAKDLVKKLLTVDPKKRFTVDQALTHPWFTEDPEMLQQVTKLIEEENSSVSTPPALNLLPESVLNTPEPKRRKLMDTKENRSDASTPLLRQPSAANSAMSTTSAPDDSGVPPSDDMDTITSSSSSKMSTTS